jgi:hypothetical protein
MNNIKHIIAIMLGVILLFPGCKEDFLDRVPGDIMSDASFFSQTTDFQMYVNGLYDGIDRTAMSNRWNISNGSDNVVLGSTPAAALMQQSASGQAPSTSDTWDDGYDYIREVNYLIENVDKADPTDVVAQHYIGEAYYCRAHRYFTLLQNFGGVPYIDKVLNVDDEELYTARESRDFIAGKIIEDLDIAISKLNWKGEGEAVAARINKETALLLKTRVGLFEGSWEYYHGAKGTQFKVDGENGSAFLDEVIEAGDILIAKLGTNIFIGRSGFEYEDLFNKEDYEDNASAFFYKHYSNALSVTHNGFRTTLPGFYVAPTKNVVDAYLMSDGKPQEISSVVFDKTNQSSLLRARDPRLAQTIYPPDRGGYKALFGFFSVEQFWNTNLPDLNHSYVPNGSGYRIIKGTAFTTISLDINETDDLIMRYEEVLLNYAEAKAIKGTITQQDIDKTINVLRGRVGMIPMNIAEVNGWIINYSESNGFDPSASNVLNEIRRERRVELMFEGFRTDDIKRWALYEKVFNGYKPQGAYFQEIFDYWNNVEILTAAGMTADDIAGKILVKGENCNNSGDYIRCFWRNSDFTETGSGYYIDPERNYLEAIPKGEIQFYEEKAGVTLTQNPGWF